MGLASRLVVLAGLALLGPHLPASAGGTTPSLGWGLFSAWDGAWYTRIATTGYEFARDSQAHSIAFFPLFPLAMRALMLTGLPAQAAGVLVNTGAFFGALSVLFFWLRDRH